MAKGADEETDKDVSVEDAAERLTQQVRDKVKTAETEPEEEDDDDETDAVDDDSDADDEPRPSRKERRANRVREFEDRANQAERRAEALAAQQQQLMQQLIQMQQPREPVEDPSKRYEEEFVKVQTDQIGLSREYNERINELAQYGQRMSQEEQEKFARKNFQIEQRKTRVMGDYYTAQNSPQLDPRAEQARMETAVLRAQHADVFANPAAAFHVGQAYQRMMRIEGKPDSLATAQAAIMEARKVVLKQGGTPKPTKSDKAKFTGSSTGSAGGAAREGVPVLKIGPDGKKMADAAYPHIKDDKKRYETWAKNMYGMDQAQRKERAR